MTFESEGLYIVAIYIWLPPASYVVFLTTLVFYQITLRQMKYLDVALDIKAFMTC